MGSARRQKSEGAASISVTYVEADPTYVADTLEGTSYRVIAPLGRGGMGEVVLAEHIGLGKPCVVKLLHPELARRLDLVDRMRLEAQALARLSHPNLVEVIDFGTTAGGRPYIVMERLVGKTLREELGRRRALPVGEVAAIGRQMLAGLTAVHDAGLVHRDIKPDNVFLCTRKGEPSHVKLIDFGVAKLVYPPSTSTGNFRTLVPLSFPTEEGIAIGTPRFFAPEQARCRVIDARADLYSTAVVLYLLLAGRGPFDHRRGPIELMRAHALEAPEAPSVYASQLIPLELDRAIMKALAKNPTDRFANATAFSNALANSIAGFREGPCSPSDTIPVRASQTWWSMTELMVSGPPPFAIGARAQARQETMFVAGAEPRSTGPAFPLVAKRIRDDDSDARLTVDIPTKLLARPLPHHVRRLALANRVSQRGSSEDAGGWLEVVAAMAIVVVAIVISIKLAFVVWAAVQ